MIRLRPLLSIFILIAVSLLLPCPLAYADDTLDSILYQGENNLEQKIDSPLVISLGSLSFQDKSMGSSFGAFLEQKMALLLSQSGKIKFFAKDKLEEILRSIEFSLSDLADPATAPRVGKLAGVEGLVFGKYFDEGLNVRLYLDLVKIESGLSLAKTEIVIPKSAIPATLSILPDNYNDALYVLDQLSDLTKSNSEDFKIKLWTARGNGATFKDGEEIVVNFFSTRDCFIKVYSIDVKGNVKLIFPNKYYGDNFIKKGDIYKIPDSRYPFRFVLGEPFGTEFIKVVASTLQFKEIEKPFEDIGKASSGLFTKGLNVTGVDARTAEAMFNYTIIRK